MPDALDQIFMALASPTRRAIIERLMEGEVTVNDLAAPFALSQPTISSHVQILENAGLVRRSRRGSFRPVRLDPVALRQAHHWIGRYERFWAENLAELEAYAKTLEQEDTRDDAERTSD